MAEADNIENERLLKVGQLQKKSTHGTQNPCVPFTDYAACNMSDTDNSLRKIQKVATQLVMNSPDRQRSLIRPHLRATAPYESPDSCPPPPNNTPDSGPSNSLRGCASSAITPSPYSTVKVLKPSEQSQQWITPTALKPPEKNSHWTVTPVTIANNTPDTNGLAPPVTSSHWTATPVTIENNTPLTNGLAPPVISSHWTATPVSVISTPDNASVTSPGNNTGSGTGSPPPKPTRLSNSNISTPWNESGSVVQAPGSKLSSHASPLPNIVVTPPGDNSFVLSTPGSEFFADLSRIGDVRLRSDSEGSVSSILSLNSAMCKLNDTSQESNSSSVQGVKGSDVQSDMSSDMESPKSLTTKPSPLQYPKEDSSKKRSKDMRKRLLQDLMSAEMTRREEELLKKHNVKLMNTPASQTGTRQPRIRRPTYIRDPETNTCGSAPVKLIFLILFLALTSLLVAWIFTDILGPLQRRILVGDWDSVDAVKEPYRLPWIKEHEDVGNIYKYGGLRDVITQLAIDKDADTPDENKASDSADVLEFEDADLGVLDQSVSFSDLTRLEETNDLENALKNKYSDTFESAIEEVENESNDLIESSDSDVLDNGIVSDEDIIENMKPTVLKLLYHSILRCHENGDINMKSYTNMYRYLNSFLTTFGTFAATQSKMLNDRIHTLEKLREHNINYTLASTMFKYETASGLIDNEYPISGSMIFTCLHRHLQYLTEALRNIEKLRPNQSLFIAFKAAYDDVLAAYHHWFVERFYLLGLTTLPTKGNALMKLNDRFVEISSMAQLSKGLNLIIEQLHDLNQATEILINKHNVTEMVPAQVITR